MNTSLSGQYTCFIDHQPIVSYSLETDRGEKIVNSLCLHVKVSFY